MRAGPQHATRVSSVVHRSLAALLGSIGIHWLHYEYGVTHVLKDAERLEELYESPVNHVGEEKTSVLS